MTTIKLEEPRHPPIFILSLPRSGSTLLRNLVDTHSKICSPGEMNLADLCYRLRFSVTRTLGRIQGDAGREEIAASVAKQCRAIVSGIMEAYARAKGKKIWCEKTAGYLQHLEHVEILFPEARFICLYRNCLDTVQSQLEVCKHGFMEDLAPYAAGNPMNLVAAMIDSWVDKTEVMRELQQRRPEQVFAVKYEEMVTSPAQTLKPMFEFLGVPWEEEILRQAFVVPHETDGGDAKIHFTTQVESSYIGKGSTLHWSEMPPKQVARMNRVLGELGYPEVGPDWNDIPSPYAEAAAGSGDGSSVGSVQAVFEEHIPGNLEANAEAIDTARARYKFKVTGADPAVWVVDLTGEVPRVIQGDGDSDCTVILDGSVLLDIANRRLNPVTAFTEGKVQVQGNFDLVVGTGIFL